MLLKTIQHKKWLLLALVVLLSNAVVYQLAFIQSMAPSEATGVVLGSFIDCAIVVPILFMLHVKQWSIKKAILYGAGGIIFARLIIPTPLIEPFAVLTWSGIAVEAAFVVVEISLLLLFVRYLPVIIKEVKASTIPMLFAFPQAAVQKAPNNFIIQLFCTELLIFYYAFFTWRKKAPSTGFTIHKNSMYVAVLVMIFHACIFEAMAFHWLMNERWPLVAWVHLALSIYGLIFFLADFNATRLNPAVIRHGKLYVSTGLLKRTVIDLQQIKAIHTEIEHEDLYVLSVLGSTEDKPQFVLEMHEQQKITLAMGLEKQARFIGFVVDEPQAMLAAIEQNADLTK